MGKAKNALKAWEKIDKILEKYWLNFKKKEVNSIQCRIYL